MTKITDIPAIRFKGFSDTWEQRKFSDLVQIERGGSPRPIDDFITDSPDGLNWVKIGDAPAQGNYITKTAEKIKPEGLSKTREVHPGDLILSNSMSFGKPYIMGIDGCIHDGWLLIRNTYKVFDLTFLCHLLGTPQMIIQYKSLAAGSTVNNLNKELVGNTVVTIPTIKEQRVLGQYLETLDNLITLHQRKYDKLTNVKKSMLEKMFPQNGSNAPEIRFKGFTEAWEQRKFGEVFDCTVPNNTLSRAELSYDEGTVLNVHYGDVLIKYGSVLDVQKDNIPRIPHRCREDFNGALLQDGDVIIADTAEDETTGKACEIGNLQGSAIVSGLHTMVCRPRNRMALGYLGYYLNSNAYHYQLLPLMQGIKVLSLSRSNIQKTSVSYPSAMKEQQLIASYFSQLDHLITLHQCKCQIDGCRFQSPLAITWEQRKLGDIGKARSGVGFPDAEQGGVTGIPFFKVSDMNLGGNENEMTVANNYVTAEQIAVHRWSPITELPAIFFAKVGAAVMLNRKRLCRFPFLLDNNTMAYSLSSTKWDADFAKALFGTVDLTSLVQVGALPSYNAGDVESMKIYLPSLLEQEQIGGFFKQLDDLITLHQRKRLSSIQT